MLGEHPDERINLVFVLGTVDRLQPSGERRPPDPDRGVILGGLAGRVG